MMKAKDFRRMALGLEGAIEGAHMGHPDFRANGRIFATLKPDMESGMVKLTPEEQQTFMRAHPDAFAAESGAWGRDGCTRVCLDAVDEDVLGEAMTLAWQQTARAGAPKRSTSTRPASRPTPKRRIVKPTRKR
jgi:hypothetical protein